MNSALMSNTVLFGAQCSAWQNARIIAKRNGQAPGHPPLEQAIDQDPASATFGQMVDRNPGDYIVSTPNGPTPVTVAGRVVMAPPRICAEAVLSGTHLLATEEQISQEIERQRIARAITVAEDAKLLAGNRKPFVIRNPGQGE